MTASKSLLRVTVTAESASPIISENVDAWTLDLREAAYNFDETLPGEYELTVTHSYRERGREEKTTASLTAEQQSPRELRALFDAMAYLRERLRASGMDV